MYNVEELLADKKKFYFAAKDIFNVVDQDGSGKISEDELWMVMCSLADDFGYKRPTMSEAAEIISLVDADRSGVIEFSEFRKMLQKIFKAVFEVRVAQEEALKKLEENKEKYG